MKLTGVGGVFCAAHSPNGVGVHGHTWQVIVWVPVGQDADELRSEVQTFLRDNLDHRHLPDSIAWGEDLAEWIAGELAHLKPRRIQCNRPMEHIYAEWQL